MSIFKYIKGSHGGDGLSVPHTISIKLSLIGAKSIPERPIESTSQAYYNLKKALGKKTIGAKASDYIVNKFAYGLDLEAVPDVLGQGINTRQGDLMTIKLKSEAAIASDMPTEVTVYLMAQSVVELSDSGTQILD